jgi:hypothetical protein
MWRQRCWQSILIEEKKIYDSAMDKEQRFDNNRIPRKKCMKIKKMCTFAALLKATVYEDGRICFVFR